MLVTTILRLAVGGEPPNCPRQLVLPGFCHIPLPISGMTRLTAPSHNLIKTGENV
jgi:hypothetical protein